MPDPDIGFDVGQLLRERERIMAAVGRDRGMPDPPRILLDRTPTRPDFDPGPAAAAVEAARMVGMVNALEERMPKGAGGDV